MAIFGHMSANNPLKGPTGAPTEPEDETAASEEPDTTADIMKELERSLEELDSGIKKSVGDIGAAARQQEKLEAEPPHFTISTSPTRNVYKKPEDN